jgi:hypothetical protein
MGGWPGEPANPERAKRVWQMTCTLHVAWDERLTDYHFGPGHPLAPVRVELTMRLAHEFGLWAQPGVTVAAPPPATEANLEFVHDARYITAVRTVGRWVEELGAGGLEATQFRYARMFGLGTADQPAFAGMHEASVLIAGATLAAARAAWSGPARHGASIAGGMHHAMAAHASGFGVYNDGAPPTPRSTRSPTSRPTGAGCSPAAEGMTWSTSSRGPGRTCSPRLQASPSIRARRLPPGGANMSQGEPG